MSFLLEEGEIAEKPVTVPIEEQSSRLVNKEELKDIILNFQNPEVKGYYIFQNWAKLHSEIFNLNLQELPQTVLNLWRVLKLINFGDDFIPTGLVYDTLITLMLTAAELKTEIDKIKAIDQVQDLLKGIFFKFIEFNGKYLTGPEKDELAFFKVIRPVVEGYRKIIYANFQSDSAKKPPSDRQMSRNEKLYKMHNVFIYKKNLEKLKKIQQEFKQCTFEPDLSYTTRKITAESRYLEPAKSKSQPLNNSHYLQDPAYIIPEEEYEEENNFKALPLPEYPNVSPIGVNEHLQRMQKSREIRQINSLRSYSQTSSLKNVKSFGIEQRDHERKQRTLNSYKILFMIKVEVAKRIYRIKVRQNMGVSDVVRAISMMVGFNHPEIEQIVKGYFINWEMRKNLNKQPDVQQFAYE